MADEFDAIANNLVVTEAYDYLDKRLQAVDEWVTDREINHQPADLRSLIDKVMQEPNNRGPVIVALCAALWQVRECRKGNHVDHQ